MNSRQHALLARQLIAACGGLNEAPRACRLNRSRLAEFQDPDAGAFMPADVMGDLERYCGEAIYSRALADDPRAAGDGDLASESAETVEDAALLQRFVRLALKRGRLTPRERTDIVKSAVQLQILLGRLIASADGGAA